MSLLGPLCYAYSLQVKLVYGTQAVMPEAQLSLEVMLLLYKLLSISLEESH